MTKKRTALYQYLASDEISSTTEWRRLCQQSVQCYR